MAQFWPVHKADGVQAHPAPGTPRRPAPRPSSQAGAPKAPPKQGSGEKVEEIRTRVARFRVLCTNRYTTEPLTARPRDRHRRFSVSFGFQSELFLHDESRPKLVDVTSSSRAQGLTGRSEASGKKFLWQAAAHRAPCLPRFFHRTPRTHVSRHHRSRHSHTCHFLNTRTSRSTASTTSSRWPKELMRMKPSPAGPKPLPGVVTTLAFSRISVNTSQLLRPGKCTQT